MYELAIAQLTVAAETCENNAPIYEREDNSEQAAHAHAQAKSYRSAISALQAHGGSKPGGSFTGLTFGAALEALKGGAKVARAGWNAEGMWISLSGSTTQPRNIAYENFWSKNASEWARTENGGGAEVLPCILMKTVDDRILMGWLASQSDMLAEDWLIASPAQ
jgi:hypothetical protein